MNAELTMMEAAAQKSDTAIPATGQLISGTLRAARTISDTSAISAYIWCMILALTSDMTRAYWRLWRCMEFRRRIRSRVYITVPKQARLRRQKPKWILIHREEWTAGQINGHEGLPV